MSMTEQRQTQTRKIELMHTQSETDKHNTYYSSRFTRFGEDITATCRNTETRELHQTSQISSTKTCACTEKDQITCAASQKRSNTTQRTPQKVFENNIDF